MKLQEAIEILTNERYNHHSYPTDIIGKAEALGIEALELIQRLRAKGWSRPTDPLPSETKE